VFNPTNKGNCSIRKELILKSADQIREMYILKFGSLEAFKEKIRVEREKFIAEINSRTKPQ